MVDGMGIPVKKGNNSFSDSEYVFSVSGAKVYTSQVPSDVNDPNSPNFQLGDGGGTGGTDPNKDEDKSLWSIIGYGLGKVGEFVICGKNCY